jgi:hypothetical protein
MIRYSHMTEILMRKKTGASESSMQLSHQVGGTFGSPFCNHIIHRTISKSASASRAVQSMNHLDPQEYHIQEVSTKCVR